MFNDSSNIDLLKNNAKILGIAGAEN